MTPFKTLTAVAAPIPQANLDTDQIIPKQFLSTLERTGLAKGLFYDMRFDEHGEEIPEFVLNRTQYKNTEILIAGPNFGCGSSREHAPWALADFGIRCVIAASFAEIFYNNCFNNGILPLVLKPEEIDALMQEAMGANHKFLIDLETQIVSAPSGATFEFSIEPGRKTKLLEGLDDIGLTMKRAQSIADFEERRRVAAPWRR